MAGLVAASGTLERQRRVVGCHQATARPTKMTAALAAAIVSALGGRRWPSL